jgi:type II restriction/modification system DNA methylase subunit YeeA
MKTGDLYGKDRLKHFNGGLFSNDDAIPLETQELAFLFKAVQEDWSDIDPSILGTLFERGLDPDKRSQLGAHYTDRDKIMQIITPVIIQPLLDEWAGVRAQIESLLPNDPAGAQALRAGFAQRLANFRVLDPACGSGNFLYLSLIELKNIEHRMNVESEALGLPKGHPTIGPESVLGIELNPYAAEMARVSVWIGEIQWMRRNGFEVQENPILRSLNTIENRDAVLGQGGGRAPWPRADVVVGNPPFLGNKKMIRELGEGYTTALRAAYGDAAGGIDLVAFWFIQAWAQITGGHLLRAGLVATNSIRGGANRAVLKPIVEDGRIFEAWADEPWTVDGAAVRVSMVCFDGAKGGAVRLDGQDVPEVHPDLTAVNALDLTTNFALNETKGLCFQGTIKNGDFDLDGVVAREWISFPLNPNGLSNAAVIKPWSNGMDITRRPSDKWVIDFGTDMSEQDAALFEVPFKHILINVKPLRDELRRQGHREKWWLHGESRPGMRRALHGLKRYLATPRVSKHRLFVWLNSATIPDSAIYAIARDDDTTFGILHSRFHELWSLRMGTSLEDRPRYTPSTTFETFPFPAGLTPNIPAADYAADPRAQAIAKAAAKLNGLRENWLNPADLVQRIPEVVAGYPDRIIPVSDAAAEELKTRTLTNLYNARPTWLAHAHADLDRAVADAYGWGDDWAKGMSDDDILSRLFALNQARAAVQGN